MAVEFCGVSEIDNRPACGNRPRPPTTNSIALEWNEVAEGYGILEGREFFVVLPMLARQTPFRFRVTALVKDRPSDAIHQRGHILGLSAERAVLINSFQT